MVREERPGIDRQRPPLRERGHAGDEVGAVGIVFEEDAPLQSPHHHVVEGLRGIETRLAGHRAFTVAQRVLCGNVPYQTWPAGGPGRVGTQVLF
jgi:hypothetical protein